MTKTIKTVEERLTEIREAKARYEKAMSTHGKKLVKELAKDLMVKYPEITGIRWTQFTPHFNDGDACEFSINEPHVLFTQEFLDSLPKNAEGRNPVYEDDASEWIDYISSSGDGVPDRLKEIDKAINAFYSVIQELETALLDTFGDDTEVTILKSGKVTAEEYEHD